jgi:pimeloyl-ACP methyl ester carboxylesterase
MPNKRDVRRVEREFATRSAHYRAGLHARAGRTIVIWGEQAGFLHADAPDMIVKRLDCGALPMLERPGEVQELIREFLFD